MNSYVRLTTCLLISAVLSGCFTNPKLLEKVDGALCTKTKITGAGDNITVVVGGASKSVIVVDGTNCSIATQGVSK